MTANIMESLLDKYRVPRVIRLVVIVVDSDIVRLVCDELSGKAMIFGLERY